VPDLEAPTTATASLDLAVLRRVHNEVMQGYATALGDSQKLRRSRAGEEAPPSEPEGAPGIGQLIALLLSERGGGFFAPLVRLLSGAHVRQRLRALSARYAQLQLALDPTREEEEEEREWLAVARDDTAATAETLPSLRLPGVFALLPIVTGVVGLTSKLATSKVPSLVWWFAGAIVVPLALLAYHDLQIAYRRKREFFLPGAMALDREPPERQRQHTGKNVYRVEDELFALVGSGKSKETELDKSARDLTVVLIVEAALLGALLYGGTVALLAGGVIAVAVLLLDAAIHKQADERIWR
jgi:hypothetical protein